MITFAPPELKDKLAKSMTTFRNILEDVDIEFYPIDDSDFDPASHEDEIVTEATLMTLYIPRSGNIELEVKEFLGLCEELPTAKIIEDVEYRSLNRSIIRIEPTNDKAMEYLYHTTGDGAVPSVELSFDLGESRFINLSLVSGFSYFALLVVKNGDYDKYNPPYLSEELFVQALYPKKTAQATIDHAINAYLFELSTSLGLDFSKSPRPAEFESNDEALFEKIAKTNLRPLIHDTALKDLLELYNRAIALSHDEELEIFLFVRVLEYVSATVVRMSANEDIRKRLLSPKALRPDARFISDLIGLVDSHRVNRKDAEALRLTVEVCCDAVELAKLAPEYIGALKQITEDSTILDKKKALSRLAACFSATRNQFAHAKANYERTGDECPLSQRVQLANCARLAAQQAIRWFGTSDADLRAL